MLRRYSVNFALLSIFFDVIAIVLSFSLSAILWEHWSLNQIFFVQSPLYKTPLFWMFLSPVIWIGMYLNLGLYEGYRNFIFADEVFNLTIGAFFSIGTVAGLLYIFSYDMPRMLFLSFSVSAYFLQILWRIGVRTFWRLSVQIKGNPRGVLIVGAGNLGRQIADYISDQYNGDLRVVGFLDDDPEKQSLPGILGPLSELHEILKQGNVSDVVIALPMYAYQKTTSIVMSLRNHSVKLWIIPASFRLALYRVSVENFAGIPMFDLQAPAISQSQRLIKRIFDIIASSILILVFSIPMAIVALLIRLDSPGPVIFSQKRVGESGKLFVMYKFRTMVKDAERLRHLVEKTDESGNLIHKFDNDPRITRIGRTLRRLSLDELPQFFNVLNGDMSLVGPRPELPYLVEKYEPWQYARLTVPQGITGWWQVNGRSDKPMHLNTEDDLFYIKHYSFFLDLQILVKTALVVFIGKGAF